MSIFRMHNSADLFFTFRRGSAVRALACLCVFLLSVFLLAGCEDGDGDGTDAVTAVAYTCTNGTADSGTTTAANTERCTECNEGFSLSGTVCVTPYICTNGSADGDTTTAANTERGAVLELVFTIEDTADLELDHAWGITIAVIDGTTYLFAAAFDDDGVSVFSVANNGELTVVDSVDDSEDANLNLNGAIAVTTAIVGDTTYLFVAGYNDSGVSVFSVADDGELTSVHNVADDADLELDGPVAVTTAAVGGTTYLFVSGDDDGVSVFSVADGGTLTAVDDVEDTDNLYLDGPRASSTAVVGGTTYLFVAGSNDNGISVFSVADGTDAFMDDGGTTLDGGTLTVVDSVEDTITLELTNARAVNTAIVCDSTYLFVAGSVDNGVSVFSVADTGELTAVDSVDGSEDADLELDGAIAVTTATVGRTTYLFVAGSDGHGFTVFSVADGTDAFTNDDGTTLDGGTLTAIASVDNEDSDELKLNRATGLATAAIGDTTYLFVGGRGDDTINVFRVQ